MLDNVKNAWVRNVTTLHFAGSLVNVREGAKWITVQDCMSLEPVAMRAGGRRFTYRIEGQLTLVQRKPPTAQNYAFGHIGIHATVFNTRYQDLTKEDGYIESWDKHVSPGSLYLKQLEDRLGSQTERSTYQ